MESLTASTNKNSSIGDPNSFSVQSLVVARRMLALFEGTFDLYQEHELNQSHHSARNIVLQLRLLRQTVQHHLPVIVKLFIETLKTGPNLVRLNSSASDQSNSTPLVDFLCFGDLHGSLTDLLYLRELYWKDEATMQKYNFVFLGDYVDRGIHGFEIATYLILLKLVHPNKFTVLRGNHEVSWLNRSFFLEECRLKFGRQPGQRVWGQLNAAFSVLPYAALINSAVFVVHGGIPYPLGSLAEIDQLIPKGLVDEHFNLLALQLLWNDFRTPDYDRRGLFVDGDVEEEETVVSPENGAPVNEEAAISSYFVPNTVRNIGFITGHRAVRHFMRRHGLSYIVRAHQYDSTVKSFGYNTHSAKKVLTIFSNSAYVGQLNSTACVCLTSAANSIDIIGLRDRRRNRREGAGRNHSEIFECDALADMKFGF